jgi:hypothetical protein
VVEKYKRSSRRVILLDYGSAYAPHSLVGNLMVDARRAGASFNPSPSTRNPRPETRNLMVDARRAGGDP